MGLGFGWWRRALVVGSVLDDGECFGRRWRFDREACIGWQRSGTGKEKQNGRKRKRKFNFLYYWVLCIIGFFFLNQFFFLIMLTWKIVGFLKVSVLYIYIDNNNNNNNNKVKTATTRLAFCFHSSHSEDQQKKALYSIHMILLSPIPNSQLLLLQNISSWYWYTYFTYQKISSSFFEKTKNIFFMNICMHLLLFSWTRWSYSRWAFVTFLWDFRFYLCVFLVLTSLHSICLKRKRINSMCCKWVIIGS